MQDAQKDTHLFKVELPVGKINIYIQMVNGTTKNFKRKFKKKS